MNNNETLIHIGDKSLRTTGSPKVSDCYGDGASIVDCKIEGKQLIFHKKYCATHGGAKMLYELDNSDFETVYNVYQIFYDIELYYAVYYEIKSNPGNMTPGEDNLNLDGIKKETFKK